MKTQEAKKKNEETLKLLRAEEKLLGAEEKKLNEIEKRVSKLEDSLYKESSRLKKQIERLAHKYHYARIIRICDTAYRFHKDENEKFQHGLRQNEYNKFDLYDVVDQIIPPSKKKSHLGFKVGHQIRIKQEGFVPFRIGNHTSYGAYFNFPANIEVVKKGGSHYVLGESQPQGIKNPLVRTKIMCFYEDGKALVYYSHRVLSDYYEIVDLSNYESCDHLNWHKPAKTIGVELKEIDREKFPKYLKNNGLTEEIEFDNKFGFRVGESIYVKSHEIILDNPNIKYEEFELALGKDLRNMKSFHVRSKDLRSGDWKVFGFVGDKVLVEFNLYEEFIHFELFSPEEIGLIIDLDYRLKKENYFDKIAVDNYGNISKIK